MDPEPGPEQSDRLNLLLDVTNLLISRLEIGELFHALSGCLNRTVQHEYTSVCLTEGDGSRAFVHLVVFDGVRRPDLEGRNIPIGEDSQRRFRIGEAIVYDIEYLHENNPLVGTVLRPLGLRSFCSTPLRSARGTLGILNVASRRPAPFGDRDITLLKQVCGQIAIAIENALAFEEIKRLKDQLATEKEYLQDEIQSDHGFAEIVGQSAALRSVLDQVNTVAATDATVLITGETGTGKELIARAIHGRSPRQHQTFVRVNSAAIPSTLIESELFGHERGAFTGATATRIGRFEIADKGTLFLDEVGDLPLDTQPKLLRTLQEREIERLGSSKVRRVDVRVIAATNRDLAAMVNDGDFRSDLFYRLNVFPIHLPALRDRREDVPPLVRHFVTKHAMRLKRTITRIPETTMEMLCAWQWPGNIRELENVIERSVILSKGSQLTVALGDMRSAPVQNSPSAHWLADAERTAILEALRATRGILGGPDGAASRLGLKRTTLQSKMRKLGIQRPSY